MRYVLSEVRSFWGPDFLVKEDNTPQKYFQTQKTVETEPSPGKSALWTSQTHWTRNCQLFDNSVPVIINVDQQNCHLTVFFYKKVSFFLAKIPRCFLMYINLDKIWKNDRRRSCRIFLEGFWCVEKTAVLFLTSPKKQQIIFLSKKGFFDNHWSVKPYLIP